VGQYDILAIGNAIVDVIAPCDDNFINAQNLSKGSMQLVDQDQAHKLYQKMDERREISGGSAANTLAGLAKLGQKCAFVGQVADDSLGDSFARGIKDAGIDFDSPKRGEDPATARCLIFVTPDAQRTMNTFLGAAQYLPASAIDETTIKASKILYLEGYLWDPAEPRAAMRRAIGYAKEAGNRVALTLSDAFVIDRYRDDFNALLEEGLIDILFANEVEICALTQNEDFDASVDMVAPKTEILVVTRGENGAIAVKDNVRSTIKAQVINNLIDTTGAGDLFAAGFLSGISQNKSMMQSLLIGSVCAAEIISHFGARPEADIAAMVNEALAQNTAQG